MKMKAWVKESNNQGRLPTYMPVQNCTGNKTPKPKRYEMYTRLRKGILIKRKYQTVSPIKAEGQKEIGAKAVDAISPATPA